MNLNIPAGALHVPPPTAKTLWMADEPAAHAACMQEQHAAAAKLTGIPEEQPLVDRPALALPLHDHVALRKVVKMLTSFLQRCHPLSRIHRYKVAKWLLKHIAAKNPLAVEATEYDSHRDEAPPVLQYRSLTDLAMEFPTALIRECTAASSSRRLWWSIKYHHLINKRRFAIACVLLFVGVTCGTGGIVLATVGAAGFIGMSVAACGGVLSLAFVDQAPK
jgi:hypothetical protein